MLDAQTAIDVLRLDADVSDSGLVGQLLQALPAWLEVSCGIPEQVTRADGEGDLAKTLEKCLLQLWYCPDGTDATRLQRAITSLAKTVRAQWATSAASPATPELMTYADVDSMLEEG